MSKSEVCGVTRTIAYINIDWEDVASQLNNQSKT